MSTPTGATVRRFDPDLAVAASAMAPLDPDDHAATRAAMAAMAASLPAHEPRQPVAVSDRTVSGADAHRVPVRLYVPTTPGPPRPAIVYPHWGGFVAGGPGVVHPAAMRLADEVDAVVVSVDYRLAPEHPYPAALDDCDAALTWLVAEAHELGVDPARVAVVGESAGGGLAAALAQLARDRGGPPLAFQALSFAELDDRLDTVSAREFVDTPMWDRRSARASWRDYLGPLTSDEVDAHAAPARADDLTGLPPAFVVACEFDPLRDEDLAYATRLVQARVPTELHLYPGTFHASTAVADAAVSARMTADLVAALRRALHTVR